MLNEVIKGSHEKQKRWKAGKGSEEMILQFNLI